MSHGVVVSYDPSKGFGFIRSPSYAKDVFVHASAVAGRSGLRPGQRVRFRAEPSDRGPRAVLVEPGSIGLTPAAGAAVFLLGIVTAATIGLRFVGFPWLFAWLPPINLATIAAWAWDKHRAVRNARRVPEAALLGLAALGGTIGALIGVFSLGHKRRKPKFLAMLWAIAALQVFPVIAYATRLAYRAL